MSHEERAQLGPKTKNNATRRSMIAQTKNVEGKKVERCGPSIGAQAAAKLDYSFTDRWMLVQTCKRTAFSYAKTCMQPRPN